MNFYETIGFFWVVFSAGTGTTLFFYCAFLGIRRLVRQAVRGEIEDNLDLRRASELKFLERIAK